MNPRPYLFLSGAIFDVVGILHLLRAALGIPVAVGSGSFPLWLSWIGGVIALLLSLWAFRLAVRVRPA